MERRFEEVPWSEYRRLDRDHRSRTLSIPEWFPDWHLIQPNHVGELADRSQLPVIAGGLMSMHPDGFVREAAVEVLSASDDPGSLPFLIVRCTDWVTQVRTVAQDAVDAHIGRLIPEEMIRALPLLEHLVAERVRASEFAGGLLRRVRSAVPTSLLIAALDDPLLGIRRACARTLIERGDASVSLDAALVQSDVVTACLIGNAALDQSADTPAVLDQLANSDVASLRSLALLRRQKHGGDEARSASRAGLLDRSPAVRDLAQRFLEHQGVDLRDAYLAELPDHVVAIQGLAEVGGVEDAATIEPFLQDPRTAARRAAVYAIGRLLGQQGTARMLAMLDDPSPSVVRAAGRMLAREQHVWSTLDDLWPRATADPEGAICRAVFNIVGEQSKWPKLLLACRALVASDPLLADRGALLLEAVQASWNRSATRPGRSQLEELRQLAPAVRQRVACARADELDDVLKHAG